MPLEFGVWRVDERTTKLEPSHLAQEAHLEKAIENDIGLIDGNLLLIGRQVTTGYGKKIDLLAINFDGDLVVIEIKRDKTPREIVAQTLDYASWILKLAYDEITEIHDAYFHDAERDYLARAWLIDPSDMDTGRDGPTDTARDPGTGKTSMRPSA